MDKLNRLVLIGNGFDLAHGLKTSYKNFLDWYLCSSFNKFKKDKSYSDLLIDLKNKFTSYEIIDESIPITFEEVLNQFSEGNTYRSIAYNSVFFKRMIELFKANNWVDIEKYYFKRLKDTFSDYNIVNKIETIKKLNNEFDFIIVQLSKYINTINELIHSVPELKIRRNRLEKIFDSSDEHSNIKFLNFNYTETLRLKYHIREDEIIHIHGRVLDSSRNPIIFGYGDESDPSYQSIEDSGENVYLEHIKSFGYFRTNNYSQLLSYIDSAPYNTYIVGHSCGLSDRVLLNTIFEHSNCKKIEIFYHVRSDGSDNFKEVTQEISRHFKPNNKDLMRRRVSDKNEDNIIPQNE